MSVHDTSAVHDNSLAITGRRTFTADGDRYVLALEDVPIVFTFDRAHRERGDLVGELAVTTKLTGARAFDGTLSISSLNLSSATARQSRAKLLESLSRADQIDWARLLEEFSIRVLAAEGVGQPGVRLCDVATPTGEQEIAFLDGLPVPIRHSTILFGDGGSLKSMLLLYGLGRMAADGVPCALFDWELDAVDHRARATRLFAAAVPRDLHYMRCERPLVYEADRIRRFIREHGILYAGLDSIGFGTAGPPEAAEHALAYNQALRSLHVGTLLTAHVTKSGDQADQRPFGSAFWHNSARATWFVKVAATSPDGRIASLGLFNRKSNLGALRPAIGLEAEFGEHTISIQRVNPASVEELSAKLPTWQRMKYALRGGPMTLAALAAELDVKVDTVTKAATRSTNTFVMLEGQDGVRRVSLVTRRVA